MELVMEILLDLILDGSLEIVNAKKIPMVIRILAGCILVAAYGGLAALGIMLIVSGVRQTDVPLVLVGVFLFGLMAVFAVLLVRKCFQRR